MTTINPDFAKAAFGGFAASIDAPAYVALVRDMHNPDKKAATAATPWARATFALLIDALARNPATPDFTMDSVISAVCNVYQPTTATGKRKDTVGALRTSGWQAMAKRLTDAEYVMRNIGIGDCLDIVADFVANPRKGDSFAALMQRLRDAIKESAPTGEGEGEGEGEGDTPPPAPGDILAEGITALMGAINSADTFTVEYVADDLRNLAAMIAIKLDMLASNPGDALKEAA